ncbi:MAG: hypothetical protein KFF77_05240 [Bacteroidetes bacterium]|nr:hypothetical protein [Bacteroidota bacterium]
MTILVLGHLVLDEIHSHEGAVYHTPGGITFPVSTFASLVDEGDRLLPLFPYGHDAASVLHEIEAGHPEADFSHCWEVPHDNTRVRLFHESPSQYNTQLVRSLGSIPSGSIDAVLPDCDLVYLNMMTGHDVTLDTAARLRGEGRLVYVDLHMIAYRVHDDGRREPAPAACWRDWLRVGDVLQCNEREFAALVPGESQQERIRAVFDTAAPRFFVLTKGEQGADVFLSPDEQWHVPAVTSTHPIDPTGCGDTFGSTLAFELARGTDVGTAAARAAQAASFVAGIPGSDGLRGLRAWLAKEGVS